jgi:hypothetical protein
MCNPKSSSVLFLLTLLVLAEGVSSAQTESALFETKVRPVLVSRCFQCHGEKVQMAGVDLSSFRDGQSAASQPDLWRRVREKVEGRLMPPPPLSALGQNDAASLVGWIDSVIRVPRTASSPGPGRVTARRLNRVEFNNTIRDFLGVSVRPADEFPIDNQGYGFDNIGDVLTRSPMLMEG